MAGMIFLLWYVTMGIIFWMISTNSTTDETKEYINDLMTKLSSNRMRYFVWYGAMAVVIITWPSLILSSIRKKYMSHNEDK